MAVSKAVVPLLKGEAAKSIRRTLNSSKIRPYSSEQRIQTDRAVKAILERRTQKCQNG